MNLALSGLGDLTPWIVIAAVVVGILAVIGISMMLSFVRRARSELADELKRELKAQAEAARVEVQDPIHVKAAAEFATKEEHRELAAKLDDELGRERSSRKKIHEEVALLQGAVKTLGRETELQSETLRELKADGKIASSKVDTLIGEMKQLNQQTQQIALAVQSKARA